MRFGDTDLTPAPKHTAHASNYTWYNGKGEYPEDAGFVFTSKWEFADQVNLDYPDGVPVEIQGGEPTFVGEGTVIGGPGFGWVGQTPRRFPHIGHVWIGYGVEIGSNVTIDRGAIGHTVIKDYVKIDNGVHVGHNASVGSRSLLTAHCVIGGSARIGEDVFVGLGALIKNQVTVGDRATIGMGAVVIKDVPQGATVVGNPARPI